MHNLVHSLKFDLHCRDEQQAFALRQAIAGGLQAMMAEIIDRVCARHIPVNETVRIGRLDLDLGNLPSATLDETFARQFSALFEARLVDQLQRQQHNGGPVTAMDMVLQVFTCFMQTGRLPWWASPDEYDLTSVCNDLIQRMPAALLAFFKQHTGNILVWRRVVKQLDPGFRQFLFTHIDLLRQAQAAWPGVIEDIKLALLRTALPSAQSIPQLQPAALVSDQPVGGGTTVTGPAGGGLMARVLARLAQYAPGYQVYLLEHVLQLFAHAKQDNINELLSLLILEDLFPEQDKESGILKAQLKGNLHLPSGQLQQPPLTEPIGEPAVDLQETLPGPERIMIRDAGLVLLGPYLKPLFTSLGYWQDGAWHSPEAREKAVCLLHFIVTGNTTCKEYDLVLGKLLCGMPLQEPLYTGYTFDNNEIKEAETLLEAVIAHWTALKNTSVEGFRSAFLQREAMLFPRERDWQLVVERKTLDVLLESIPWGYGTLALSWNTYLIFTEW